MMFKEMGTNANYKWGGDDLAKTRPFQYIGSIAADEEYRRSHH